MIEEGDRQPDARMMYIVALKRGMLVHIISTGNQIDILSLQQI